MLSKAGAAAPAAGGGLSTPLSLGQQTPTGGGDDDNSDMKPLTAELSSFFEGLYALRDHDGNEIRPTVRTTVNVY